MTCLSHSEDIAAKLHLATRHEVNQGADVIMPDFTTLSMHWHQEWSEQWFAIDCEQGWKLLGAVEPELSRCS